VVGQRIHQYFGTEDVSFPPIAAHLRALAGEAVTYELEWQGRTFLAHVQPLRSPEGTRSGVIGAALDITARKEMEEEVREAEARYHALVEHVPAVMYVAAPDPDRSPIYVSPQIERILGCSPEAWKANPRSWVDRIHPADRDRVLLEVALCPQLDDALSVEYRLAGRDGGDVWVHDEAVLLRDLVGNPSQWQGVLVVVGHRAEVRAVAGLRQLLEEARDDEGGAPWSP
jgi:PAS domain S-box-containing protein